MGIVGGMGIAGSCLLMAMMIMVVLLVEMVVVVVVLTRMMMTTTNDGHACACVQVQVHRGGLNVEVHASC